LKFSEVDLHPSIKSAVEKLGFTDCTAIQEAAIPHVLAGRDIAGLSQTGTGKTAAFLMPLMTRVLWGKNPPTETEPLKPETKIYPDWQNRNFVLVLVPTRELAEQVQEHFHQLRGDTNLRITTIYGGVGYDKQKEDLASGVEFVVATPGRLIDLYKEHFLDLRQVRGVVFDEADRMFDMGFKDDVKYILTRIPKERQLLLFSATLNFDVLNMAYQVGSDPIEINLSRDQAKAENVKDAIYHVGNSEKPSHLLSLIRAQGPKQAIIFTNYKHNVDRIATFLTSNGHPAVGISSLLSQSQRNRVMGQFKADDSGQNILVATDLAARGLDVTGVDLVVNYDMPEDAETYVHRIGRTGRAGKTGEAFSLVSDDDVPSLERVQEFLKNTLPVLWMDEAQLVKEFKPFLRESRPRHLGVPTSKWPGHDKGQGRRPDRPQRRDGLPSRGPRNDGPPRGDRPQAQSRSEGQGNQAHRDRLTGRHGQQGPPSDNRNNRDQARGQTRDQRPNRSGTQENRDLRGNRDNRPPPRKSYNNKTPPRQYAAKPKPATGITEKVKGFLKKIFN